MTVEEALSARIEGWTRSVEVCVGDDAVTVRWNCQWSRQDALDPNAWHLHRGTCAWAAVPGGFRRKVPDDGPGTQWWMAWVADRDRVLRIDGLADDDLAAAVAILADTARAVRIHERLAAQRREQTLRGLAEAADAWDDAAGKGLVAERAWWRREARIRTAVAIGECAPEEIRDAARVKADQIELAQAYVRAHPDRCPVPPLTPDERPPEPVPEAPAPARSTA
ncbi:hypothetical protein [Amycolatopsis rubida]|nr:hypothetical protein [Amycolatopsis rubida]